MICTTTNSDNVALRCEMYLEPGLAIAVMQSDDYACCRESAGHNISRLYRDLRWNHTLYRPPSFPDSAIPDQVLPIVPAMRV